MANTKMQYNPLYSGLSAIASTTTYVNPTKFKSHSSHYEFNPKNYSGRGYVNIKTPNYPSIPLQPWTTNTSLELREIVYPDGTPKNNSYAQQQVASASEQAAARNKLSQLERQFTVLTGAGRLNEAAAVQTEIEQLQHKYFPSEIQVRELRNNNAAIGNLPPLMRNITVSAQGHARAAEAQRLAILAELQNLARMGLVAPGAGGVPVAPTPPTSGAPPPSGSGPSGSGPPMPSTPSGSPITTAPSTPALTGSSASPTTVTTGSSSTRPVSAPPASTVSAGGGIDSKQEEVLLDSISNDLAIPTSTYKNLPDLINDIYTSTGTDQKTKLSVAVNALEKDFTIRSTSAAKTYLFQLAMISKGRAPGEVTNAYMALNMGNTSTYKGYQKKVDDYLGTL